LAVNSAVASAETTRSASYVKPAVQTTSSQTPPGLVKFADLTPRTKYSIQPARYGRYYGAYPYRTYYRPAPYYAARPYYYRPYSVYRPYTYRPYYYGYYYGYQPYYAAPYPAAPYYGGAYYW